MRRQVTPVRRLLLAPAGLLAATLPLLLAASLGLSLTACDASPPDDGGADGPTDVGDGSVPEDTVDGPPPTGVLELGTTEYDGSGFLPFEGDHALAPGSQGGFHIWLKFRISGVPAGRHKLARIVRRIPDETLLLRGNVAIDVGEAGAEGYFELPDALPSFICPPPLGVEVIDRTARFEVKLLTFEDEQLLGEATGEVTMHCPEGDQFDSCQRICAP